MSKKNRMIAKTHTPGDPGDILDGLLQRRRAMKWPNGGYGPATPLGFGAMGAGGMAGGFGSCDGSAVMSSIKKPVDGENDDNEINYDDEIDFLGNSLKTDENADIIDALTKGAKVIVNNYICNNGKKNDVYIGKTKSKKCCRGDECCHGHHGHHHCEDNEEWIKRHMEDFMDMIGPDHEDDQELSDAINAAVAAIMEADAASDPTANLTSSELEIYQTALDDVKEKTAAVEKLEKKGEDDAMKTITDTNGTANADQNEVSAADMSSDDLDKLKVAKKNLEDARKNAENTLASLQTNGDKGIA